MTLMTGYEVSFNFLAEAYVHTGIQFPQNHFYAIKYTVRLDLSPQSERCTQARLFGVLLARPALSFDQCAASSW